ncbi:hypothetical protein INT47_003979 [Mucor saturninus]|uniref:Embryonic stem cell-specific 5-hydroxymethylcytosine-binding protein n=1 Tax=Mucor saturninus TaxID=64648 RepID=A0A8H7R793_9FUNG|nr:hypothetical protein INT47_003979 [Mucor saturninus]
MCGRFCCSLNRASVTTELYNHAVCEDEDIPWLDKDKYVASYNVCPTRYVLALYQDTVSKHKVLQSMQWGFIPSWSKNSAMAKPINARSETLQVASIFSSAKPCIIIAEGFYEWKTSSTKIPFYVKRRDGQLMLFAGLYDTNKHFGDKLTTCAIITTQASEFFAVIHDRMPVILETKDVDLWLDHGALLSKSVIHLLKPYKGPLQCYQVSNEVGQIKKDTPDLIVPIDSKKSSITHFLTHVDPIAVAAEKKEPIDNEKVSVKRKEPPNDTVVPKKKRERPSNNTLITHFFNKE